MKNIVYIILLSAFVSFSQTTTTDNKNFVLTTSYQIPLDQNQVEILTNDSQENDLKIESISYIDGLGRPLQNIAIRAGKDNEDIITPIVYDQLGRIPKEYLPYPKPTIESGKYIIDPLGDLDTYYENNFSEDSGPNSGEINPYSEKRFENSPLNRVLEQGAPGWDWKINDNFNDDTDHTIKHYFQTNSSSEVKYFFVNFDSSTEDPELKNNGFYSSGELYKTVTKDENWQPSDGIYGITYEFKNKSGQVVLKRSSVFDASKTDQDPNYHDTYYIYDDFGNLTYVLSPEASENIIKSNGQIDGNVLNELAYQYKYDHRNRLIEKKIPGKGWEYILYNKLDLPVMTQDSIQRTKNEWNFTKYDALGRVAYTGISKSYHPKHHIKNLLINAGTQYESQTNTSIQVGSTDQTNIYYTYNTSVSEIGDVTILTVNYYDDYIDMDSLTLPSTVFSKGTLSQPKGLPTVSKIRVLGTTDWITSLTGYDEKGRVLITRSKNNYLDTYDYTANILDFTGKVTQSLTSHSKTGNPTINTSDYFTYDHMGRLLTHKQKINSEDVQLIASNVYDELGQLVVKGVGGISMLDGYTGLTNVDVSSQGVITNTYTGGGSATWQSLLKTLGEIPPEYDGGIELIVDQTNQLTRFGLVKTNGMSLNPNDYYDYGLQLAADGTVHRINGGTSTTSLGIPYVQGDLFRIKREGQSIEFYHNNTHLTGASISLSQTEFEAPLAGKLSFSGPAGGSVSNLNFFSPETNNTLQTVNYDYNIRGWLTDINDVDAVVNEKKNEIDVYNDLFNFRINYNRIEGNNNGTPLYNGNIAQTLWRTKSNDQQLRSYNYVYDNLNRIKEAIGYKGLDLNSMIANISHDVSGISYDLNGNIGSLIRKGIISQSSPISTWDNLTYTYNGTNKLLKVEDLGTTEGFKDGINSGNDYEYDANGNMIKDENKNITNITYNHLNLPTQVTILENGIGGYIDYVYDATGVKIKKTFTETGVNPVPKSTEYAGNFVYSDNESQGTMQLEFFNHPEGYIQPVGGTANSVKVFRKDDTGGGSTGYTGFNYVYQYKDHLGNIRLSYTDADDNQVIDSSNEIIEESNYYPFGLKQKGYNNVVQGGNGLAQNYKTYQGQEINEDLSYNMLEFRYRHYDPAIGRFVTIDPLAEDYTYNSPYAFQENKLGMGVELEGAELLPGQVAQYVAIKASEFNSNVAGARSKLGEAVGNRVEALKTGKERSNATVATSGINVNQVQDASNISESVNTIVSEAGNTAKDVTRDLANGMETTGDGITAVGIVTVQPEIVAVGEAISTTGTAMNVGLDLLEGKPPMQIAAERAPSIVIGKLGKEAVKATRNVNGGPDGNEVTETIIKAHEKVYEKIVDEVKTTTGNQ